MTFDISKKIYVIKQIIFCLICLIICGYHKTIKQRKNNKRFRPVIPDTSERSSKPSFRSSNIAPEVSATDKKNIILKLNEIIYHLNGYSHLSCHLS